MTLLDIIGNWLTENKYEILYQESYFHNMYESSEKLDCGWIHIGPLIDLDSTESFPLPYRKAAHTVLYVGKDYVSFIRPPNMILYATDTNFFINLKQYLDENDAKIK